MKARLVVLSIVLVAAAPVYGQLDFGKKKEPKGKVTLVSSVGAVVAGRAFDVALNFQLTPGWHIYWQNPGESGLPPYVEWSLPDGFGAGNLQYPVPKRFRNKADITTHILDGNPVLLTPIIPPEVIAETEITIGANVHYLICATACLREGATVQLTLPVLQTGGEAGTKNDGLFRRAREALPEAHSEYVTISAKTEPVTLTPGQPFDLLVTVDIKPGYDVQLQPHRPPEPGLIDSDLFLETTSGILFKEPVYPPPRGRVTHRWGVVSEYAGKVTIRVPGEVDAEAASQTVRLGGILRYQVSDTSGTPFPPEALSFSTAPTAEAGPTAATASATMPGTKAVIGGQSSGSMPADGDKLQAFLGRLGLVGQLIALFLYGLFINATPCVLPLISIKVLGFVQQARESRRRTLGLALAFGAGVMLFFVILGLLASAGRNVLQEPAIVVTLGAVVMALALSMLGVYTLQAPAAATKLEASIQKEGLVSSFGKGALAPVLGFACTGPLLAGAFGWATQQPPHIAILAFLFAGLGMASPYILLGANPNWLSFLPKPGPWMITFERVMGFLLLAMVIWLLGPLVAQIGATGLQWTLAFLVAVAMGCWLLGKVDMTMAPSLRWRYRGAAAAVVAVSGLLIYGWVYPLREASARVVALRQSRHVDPNDWSSGIPWQPWSEEAVEREVRSGKAVFVDFTAAWCTVCKANKKLAIDTPEAHDKMKSLGVVPFQADFTSEDAKIAAALRKHDRAGPPLDLIYRPGDPDNPIVLRTNLTKGYLLEKLDEAGPSRVASTAPPGS